MKENMVKTRFKDVITKCDECGHKNTDLWNPKRVVNINSKVTMICHECSTNKDQFIETKQTITKEGKTSVYYRNKN